MSTGLIIAIVIIAVVIILILWLISKYNGFVKLRNMVREAFSTMDVYMKKRFDLIPNLVETVKGYAAFEKDTLQKVIQARSGIATATTPEARMENENMLSSTLRSLFAVAESYPDLKANANFMDLQRQLQQIEGEIANSRKYYNAVVRDYNTRIQMFPAVIVANMFGFKAENMFEINEEQRENVKVQF